ncbi:MAG: TolC family protein [Bacteroidales bacterium]|nr:TolC family protein [Bacteroidales bacterium]
MKKIALVFLIVGAMWFIPETASSQKVISLEQALKIAADSNLNIQSASEQVQLQKALRGTAWDIGKTDIGFEYGRFNSYNVDNSVSISQTIAFPTVYLNQNRLAKAGMGLSQTALTITINENFNKVKSVWWQLAYYHSRLKLLYYQDSLFSGFQRAAKRRVESGETNKLEYLNAEMQSMEVKNQIMQVLTDINTEK